MIYAVLAIMVILVTPETKGVDLENDAADAAGAARAAR